MTRFQLVFREDGVDRVETRDNSVDGEPHIQGKLIVDGGTYVIKGVEWLIRREDIGKTPRFVCELVVQPTDA